MLSWQVASAEAQPSALRQMPSAGSGRGGGESPCLLPYKVRAMAPRPQQGSAVQPLGRCHPEVRREDQPEPGNWVPKCPQLLGPWRREASGPQSLRHPPMSWWRGACSCSHHPHFRVSISESSDVPLSPQSLKLRVGKGLTAYKWPEPLWSWFFC